MKRYIVSHLPMAIGYGLLIALIKGNWLPWESSELVRWLWFTIGTSIGVTLLYLDRIVYTYSYPTDLLSQQFTNLTKQKLWGQALTILDARRDEQNKLTFRSALFIAVWVPLSFFALTSTSSLFGKGVVMGIMLHILMDAWRMQRNNPVKLNERLFWQIARPVTHEEQLVFMSVVTGIFVVLSFWVG